MTSEQLLSLLMLALVPLVNVAVASGRSIRACECTTSLALNSP